MEKRGAVAGLLFLSLILFSSSYVHAQDVYCDDGTSTSCVHDDYDTCLSSQTENTGCWNFWERTGVTTCQYINEQSLPGNDGWKWYSGNADSIGPIYSNPCNSWQEPNTKSCVETASGDAQCLTDCYKLGGVCTSTASGQYTERTAGTEFCKNYKVVGNNNAKCIVCNWGVPLGNFPNQNCATPAISISKIGGSYNANDISSSGYVWVRIELTDAQKFEVCEINWHDSSEAGFSDKWRSTTSLYNSFDWNNYGVYNGIEEDRYTGDGTKTVQVECTGKDGAVKRTSKTIQVSLVPDGECGDADGRDFPNLKQDDTKLCKKGNVKKDSFITTTDGWTWNCIGTNPALDASCSATRTGQTPDCPTGPDANTINLGVQIPVYFAGTTEVCKTIVGTKTPIDPAPCPTTPVASDICPGIVVSLVNSNGIICGSVTGTANCVTPCPTGPDANTICRGNSENVINENGKICKVIGGTKICSAPICGDNLINAQGETCDGTDKGEKTCNFFGYTGGTLGCNANCEFDDNSCTPSRPTGPCGNGVLNQGEDCDTTTDKTCSSLNSHYTGGTLTCYAFGTPKACKFNTNGCIPSISPNLCSFTSAKWSPSGLIEKNKPVTMLLDGTSACAGKDINFKVYKSGTITPVTGSEKTWKIGELLPTWITIGKETGMLNPKYYFTATLNDDAGVTKTSELLEVADSIPLIADCLKILKCGDYSPDECGGDACKITQKSAFNFLGGTTKESQKCYKEDDFDCGWVVKSGAGKCENIRVVKTIKTGCPQSFLDGDGANYPAEIGVCAYEDKTIDTCDDDGFLNVKWEGVWSWATGNEVNKIDPTGEATKCKITEKTQPCPSQVVLSFFTIKNIILVVAIIILIYLVINIKCRKKKNSKARK